MPNASAFLFRSWSTMSVEKNIYSGLDHAKQQLLCKWRDDQLKQWYDIHLWNLCQLWMRSLSECAPQLHISTHFLCTPWLWRITSVVWKIIFPVEAVIVSTRLKQSSCLPARSIPAANVVFLPLVFGVIMYEYLFLDHGKSQLFFLGGYQNKPYYEISLPLYS